MSSANLSLQTVVLSWKWVVEVAGLLEWSMDNPCAVALLLHGDGGSEVVWESCRQGRAK